MRIYFALIYIYQYKIAQYNRHSEQLTNSQFNKLDSALIRATEVTLKPLSNMICDSNDKINFPHKLLLTNRQAS